MPESAEQLQCLVTEFRRVCEGRKAVAGEEVVQMNGRQRRSEVLKYSESSFSKDGELPQEDEKMRVLSK